MTAASALLSRAAGLFFGLVLSLLCLPGVWTTAAQEHSTLLSSPMVNQPPVQQQYSPARFLLLLATWDDEEDPLVSDSDSLYAARLAHFHVYTAAFDTFTPLAWINYSLSNALQFHLSQFVLPFDLSINAGVPTPLSAHTAENLPPSVLTILQVHGKFSLGTDDAGTLHYAFYAGLLTAENPYEFIAGARLGYMAGTRGFTIGIDYLYGRYATTSDIFGSFHAMADTQLPGSNVGIFGQALLYERSELFLIQQGFLRGMVDDGHLSLAIRAKPAVHISRQWTIFYRFDRLHPRLGMSKMVEHAIGLKFRPLTHITLQAEFIMKQIEAPSLDVGGGRFAGTFRF
jgi:hypothetical protein